MKKAVPVAGIVSITIATYLSLQNNQTSLNAKEKRIASVIIQSTAS